ncbi:hypothetical protein Pcinc_038946 [Petrolisthes cinctipes]|uniref:Uncharacterized protein n=1 Tax=Petrolisthes cinctipes TaxID=88211 RepID=A0AAE1BPH4_PETCI|nr:hypothetical protein Pcinc_038946 [Petrolisthes cinctipes]
MLPARPLPAPPSPSLTPRPPRPQAAPTRSAGATGPRCATPLAAVPGGWEGLSGRGYDVSKSPGGGPSPASPGPGWHCARDPRLPFSLHQPKHNLFSLPDSGSQMTERHVVVWVVVVRRVKAGGWR